RPQGHHRRRRIAARPTPCGDADRSERLTGLPPSFAALRQSLARSGSLRARSPDYLVRQGDPSASVAEAEQAEEAAWLSRPNRSGISGAAAVETSQVARRHRYGLAEETGSGVDAGVATFASEQAC